MSTLNQKRVAIILINWNGLRDTLECLASLANLDYTNNQVFIVDNNSDENISAICDQHPNTIIIRNQKNYGFAKGNNIGIQHASELHFFYCWILNNDTEVAPDSLSKMVDALEHDQRLGAVTNQILLYENRNRCWFAGGIFENGIPAHRGYSDDTNTHNLSSGTEYLSGCSFIARTEVLNNLNGFDEKYFCYLEDVDISLRMRNIGWRIEYISDAKIWHKVSASTGTYSPVKLYYKHRNMLYFLKIHGASIKTFLRWWIFSFRSMAAQTLKYHNPKAAWYLWLGLVDAVFCRMGKSSYF